MQPHRGQAAQAGGSPLTPPILLGFGKGEAAFTLPCGFVLDSHHRGSTQTQDELPHSTDLAELAPGPCFPLLLLLQLVLDAAAAFHRPLSFPPPLPCSTWSSRRSSASREQKHFPHILPGALAGLGRKQRLAGVSPRCCLASLIAPASRCTRFAGNSRCRLGGAELGFPRFPGPASGHSAWR